MPIRQFAAEAGQEEIRRDEDCAGQRDQRRVPAATEQDQEDQRGLEEIVVKGGKKLARKEREEFSGGQQHLASYSENRKGGQQGRPSSQPPVTHFMSGLF